MTSSVSSNRGRDFTGPNTSLTSGAVSVGVRWGTAQTGVIVTQFVTQRPLDGSC